MDIRSRLGGHLHGDDPPPKTIVKPTALSPVANTDTKLLIYGLFQKGRVLAQDGIELAKHDLSRDVVAIGLERFCVRLIGIQVALYRLPSAEEEFLRIDWPEFRHVAHHHAVSSEDHECASAFGKIWNDDPKLGSTNTVSHHAHQLLSGVDATASGVEQQIQVTVRRDIVKEIDKWHGVVRIDRALAARHIAD